MFSQKFSGVTVPKTFRESEEGVVTKRNLSDLIHEIVQLHPSFSLFWLWDLSQQKLWTEGVFEWTSTTENVFILDSLKTNSRPQSTDELTMKTYGDLSYYLAIEVEVVVINNHFFFCLFDDLKVV